MRLFPPTKHLSHLPALRGLCLLATTAVLLASCGLAAGLSQPGHRSGAPEGESLPIEPATSSVTGSRPLAGARSAGARLRAAAATVPTLPTARQIAEAPAVGALFGLAGRHLGAHFCTGSVVSSSRGDLVLTAAHCVSGASSIAFVPGYHDHEAPYGIWPVAKVLVDRRWQSSKDPNDDFAFLVVRRVDGRTLQAVTCAEQIAFGTPARGSVQVTGYPDSASRPRTCTNNLRRYSGTQFEFDCWGYTDGTSGSPLLKDLSGPDGLGKVVGVIGGYLQGGDLQQVSYAARFGPQMKSLYEVAAASLP